MKRKLIIAGIILIIIMAIGAKIASYDLPADLRISLIAPIILNLV